MTKWLVTYNDGFQEIIEAEDLYELHNKCDSDLVVAVIRLTGKLIGTIKALD